MNTGSLYKSPTPFNRYPAGYRPMSGTLRTFASTSNLSHPGEQIDSYSPPHSGPFVSHTDLNGTAGSSLENNNRIIHRAGSVGPYGEVPFHGGGFSSRVQSPYERRDYPPPQHIRSPAMSPTFDNSYYGGQQKPQAQQQVFHRQPEPTYERFHANDFLDKLRRQKEEIEQSFSRPYDEPETYAPSFSPPPRYEPSPAHHLPPPQYTPKDQRYEMNSANIDVSPSWGAGTLNIVPDRSRNVPVVPLHKTRSDSSIWNDVPMRTNNNRMSDVPRSMVTSYNENDNRPATFQNQQLSQNRLSRSFYEPAWTTHPPPPIDIQPRFNNRYSNSNDRNSYLSDRNSIIDQEPSVIPLDEDRILKIYPQQQFLPEDNQPEPQQSRVDQYSSVQQPLTVQTSSPYSQQPHDQPLSRFNNGTSNFPSTSNNIWIAPQVPTSRSSNNHIHAPQHMPMTPTAAIPPPPPPPPPAAPVPIGGGSRLPRTQSFNEFVEREKTPVRERSKTPTGVEIPRDFHEELLSVIPQRARKSPFVNRQEQQVRHERNAEAMFSPVASKVFGGSGPSGPNRVNGFDGGQNDSRRMFAREESPRRMIAREESPAVITPANNAMPPRDRSFAVISRPRAQDTFSPPPQMLRPSDFSPVPYSYAGNEPPTFSPPRSPPELNGINRTNLSPMSSTYDNDSENEFYGRRTVIGHVPGNPLMRQRVFSPPPHGILVKNNAGGIPKQTNKKVVFQCDPAVMDRIRRQQQFSSSPGGGGGADAPAHVKAYDAAMEDVLARFASLSDEIGGDVAALKPKALSVFDSLRSFLWMAAGRTEPAQDEVQKLSKPMVQQVADISGFKDSKRNTPQFNHLSAVAEGISAVGFVLVKKTPAPYVKEMIDSTMFFINRILKEFKDGDRKHVEWAKLWKEVLETLYTFVRQTHTTGIVWNSAPGSVPSGGAKSSGGPPAPSGGGPPPPPPPPPANIFADIKPSADGDKAGRDALFAELNKGGDITKRLSPSKHSGLKKVTADMQTHKNPTLRGQGSPLPAGGKGGATGAGAVAPAPKPPKVELCDGKQWNVEYQKNNKNILINIEDRKQTIYVFRCENSHITVKGKANSITLDGCKKCSIAFDALVSQCETINCQSVQIQTLGEMPTLSIQKTDGCQVYLSEAAKNAEVVTSKSSEMNILVPGGPDGDFVEFPVPEQFKTVFSNGKLVTVASDI